MPDFLTRISNYSPKQLTVLASQLWAKLEESENARREPVAIIGMACRFPGAPNLDAFWSLLHDGVDAVGEVPPNRWKIDQYYDPNPDVPGKMYTRYGAFLENVDQFDAHFFGITPREALSMDPQQRLLLEVTWEALEHAGLPPSRLVGSRTGVFIGIGSSNYAHRLVGDPRQFDSYSGTGNSSSVACGRISYILDLLGPNFPIDTACSSSLVAVHEACSHLRNDECRVAIAGGVNLQLTPEPTIFFCRMGALSPDGRCRTFDAGGSGYGRGEGCGVVVLKLLSRARADGDRILAVISGSAVNHDGHSNGLTVPNPQAQEAVIREAWKRAGVQAGQVGYLEAHGTGTPLGDPVEMRAIGTLLNGRLRSRPLLVGSVKTNFGHLEWAAGIAGMIKVILALQHGEIPPHLHYRHPNPYIPWERLPVEVVTELRSWPTIDERRIAGVSSFGFSGTNAHVVLEQAPKAEALHGQTPWPADLLCLSAKTEKGLRQIAADLVARLSGDDSLTLPSVCYTANTARSHFEHRLAVVAESVEQFRAPLSAFAADRPEKSLTARVIRAADTPKLAFLFDGQTSGYVGMARQLYEIQPGFKRTLKKCNEILGPYLQTPLLSILYPEDGSRSLLDQTSNGQAAIFALEYALAELWISWGIEPAIVLGHGLGEYVAACIAGVFSLEDGLKLVVQRGRLMQSRLLPGAMCEVLAAESVVAAILTPHADQLAIACLNGPENTVISGSESAAQAAMQEFSAHGIPCRRLAISHAFHSPLVEPILDEFETLARQIGYSRPRMGLLSNVTGRLAEGDEMSNAAYWRRQLRQPVRFANAMQTLAERGYELFVEIGPSATLSGIARACVPDARRQWLPSLSGNREDWKQMLQALQSLYLHGAGIDWQGFYRDHRPDRISLPAYPFERQRYWISVATTEVAAKDTTSPRNLDLATDLPTEIAVSDECRRLREAVLESPAEERQDFLESYLARRLAQITGIETEAVDHDQPLTDMGLDSMMAMEFRKAIESGLQISLPLATLLEGVTLSTLTARVLKAVLESPEGPAALSSIVQNLAGDGVDGGWLLDDEEIQGLSDEEVEMEVLRILSESGGNS
ncbi:MAG: type I polyketide synthase [Terracidiphilus sp.]